MKVERSFNYKSEFAYIFSKEEQNIIAKALKPEIKKLENKIVRIENNPKNEGQATYKEDIREINALIFDLLQIIDEFGK